MSGRLKIAIFSYKKGANYFGINTVDRRPRDGWTFDNGERSGLSVLEIFGIRQLGRYYK